MIPEILERGLVSFIVMAIFGLVTLAAQHSESIAKRRDELVEKDKEDDDGDE